MSESSSASPDPQADPPRRPGSRVQALHRRRNRRYAGRVGVLLLVVVAVVAGLLSRSPDGTLSMATTGASAAPAPMDSVDVSRLRFARGPFCEYLDRADVRDAMGAEVAGTAHYSVGERAPLAPGVRDRSHEFDCTFRSAAGAEARAWVFAGPVTSRLARILVRQAGTTRGCTTVGGGPRFGTPSVTTRCSPRPSSGTPPTRAVTLHGLFGDAWLSCQLTSATSQKDAVGRAQRWCVQVATSLADRP